MPFHIDGTGRSSTFACLPTTVAPTRGGHTWRSSPRPLSSGRCWLVFPGVQGPLSFCDLKPGAAPNFSRIPQHPGFPGPPSASQGLPGPQGLASTFQGLQDLLDPPRAGLSEFSGHCPEPSSQGRSQKTGHS